MATGPERVILTYDDYLELPEDGKRYELLEGELEVTPAPSTRHQIVAMNLSLLLGSHVRQHGLGMVLAAPCDVLLSEITVVQPDLLYVAHERLAIILPLYVRGAPDLVVEILSPATAHRDRGVKRQVYARHGVPHYWLIDPERREAVAFVLEEGRYRQAVAARERDAFVARPFPDLAISLAELWQWPGRAAVGQG